MRVIATENSRRTKARSLPGNSRERIRSGTNQPDSRHAFCLDAISDSVHPSRRRRDEYVCVAPDAPRLKFVRRDEISDSGESYTEE